MFDDTKKGSGPVMNEFEEEVRQRTRIAAGARHRRGRRRSGCTLPSDYLTERQRQRLNGPVVICRAGRRTGSEPERKEQGEETT